MNATQLIKHIYEENKIYEILDDLNCVGISEKTNEWRCGLPDDHNSTRIRVKKNEYLNITIFQSEDATIRGNIITLVMTILDINFPKANKYLHKLLGLEYIYKKKKKNEVKKQTPLDIFKKAKGRKRYNHSLLKSEVFYESELMEFTPNLTREWLSEGIVSFTARKFNIGYDFKSRRIIIPHSLWYGNDGEYIGIMGRTTIKNFELLGIPKYFPLKSYFKGSNLYGLQENYKTIQESGYIVVHESEKSVLKRHSRKDGTGVALCCHDITDEQVKIIVGLNVDVIISLDKGININHIRNICDKFYGLRNVYYIWDKYDILKDKEAPADKPNDLYNYLFKYKIKYDNSEKKEHTKWVENQKKNLIR